MDRFLGGKKAKKEEARQTILPAEMIEMPEVDDPPAPTVEQFLSQNLDEGPGRIVLMLTPDGNRIHTMRTQLSFAQQTVMLLDQATQNAKEITSAAIMLEEENSKLRAEVEFLRDQIAKNVSPPAPQIEPPPFNVRQLSGATD